jgi:hypothetical protein
MSSTEKFESPVYNGSFILLTRDQQLGSSRLPGLRSLYMTIGPHKRQRTNRRPSTTPQAPSIWIVGVVGLLAGYISRRLPPSQFCWTGVQRSYRGSKVSTENHQPSGPRSLGLKLPQMTAQFLQPNEPRETFAHNYTTAGFGIHRRCRNLWFRRLGR